MASNEEYLDSLLKAVSVEPDDSSSGDGMAADAAETEKGPSEPKVSSGRENGTGAGELISQDAENSENALGMFGNSKDSKLSSVTDTAGSDSDLSLSDIGSIFGENTQDISDPAPGLSDINSLPGNSPAMAETEMAEAGAGGTDYASDMIDMSDMDALLDAVSGREAPDLQDVMQMSAKDIDSLLDSSRASDSPGEPQGELTDLSDLLKSVGDDEDLEEITSLLQKSDENQAVDEGVLELLQGDTGRRAEDGRSGTGDTNSAGADTEAQSAMSKKDQRAAARKAKQEAKKAAREAKKKAKKKKKGSPEDENAQVPDTEAGTGQSREEPIADMALMGEEADAELQGENPGEKQEEKQEEKQGKEGRKGLLSKLVDFLTEEDEPEEDEASSLNLSEENAAILAEMKKEGAAGGKKKKKAKKKKGKETPEGDTEGQEEDQTKGKKGKGKQKKEKKPKKEKAPALEEVPQTPEKKLSLKRIILIAAVTGSIMAIILIASMVSGDYSDRSNAREAYYSGDYQNCYKDLFGKTLDETESVMFNRSAAVLRMRLYLREYELLVSLGQPVEALDSLIQTVDEYPKLYEDAVQWNAAEDVAQIYQQMLTILESTYGLSEEEAKSIAGEPDDIEYTRMVTAVAEGNDLAQWKDEQDRASMKDVLPEEEELQDVSFMENSEG